MPKNQKLADTIFSEMAEHLMFNPIFEDYCGMDVDMGIELIRQQCSVVEDTEHSFVVTYSIESEGGPEGITETCLRGHAYQLPFLGHSKEEVLEDFLRTNGKRTGDIGYYHIPQMVPPVIERRAA